MTSRLISIAFFLLGFGCLVLPFFGSRSIILLSILVGLLLVILTDPPEEKRIFALTLSDFAFLLLLFGLSVQLVVTFCSMHFTRFGPELLLSEGLAFRLGFIWREIAEQRAIFFNQLVGLTLGFFISRMGRRSQQISFVRGLAWGSFCAAGICMFQVLGVQPEFFDRRLAFWVMVQRYQGTLTDPNSFGMMVALVIPLLVDLGVRRRRVWYFLAVAALGIAGLWSGSRSFFLMLGLVTLFSIFTYRKLILLNFSRMRRPLIGIGIFLAAVLVVALRVDSLPIGVQRLFETFNPSTSEGMLSSRMLYTQLALEVWARTSHVFGAGLGMFYHQQELAAAALNIDLKGWHDNANNYYLQILSEGGFVGALLFIGAIFLFVKARTHEVSVNGAVLAAFLIVLLTGPHVNFNEVMILVCVLLGFSVRLVALAPTRATVMTALIFASTLPLFAGYAALRGVSSFDGSYGLYSEEGPENDRFRWSYFVGRFPLPSVEMCGDRSISFSSLKPEIVKAPQRVRVLELGESGKVLREERLTVDDNNDHELKLDSDVRAIRFQVKPAWSPSEYGNTADLRILGVVVKGSGSLYCRNGQSKP